MQIILFYLIFKISFENSIKSRSAYLFEVINKPKGILLFLFLNIGKLIEGFPNNVQIKHESFFSLR